MKRLRIVLFILALSVSVSQLTGLDHLELMTTLYGEFYGSNFGNSMAIMDYNGDDYDDVIVHSPYWNPTGVYNSDQCWGKIYFFWGGPNMDNVPDFVMEGTQNWELYFSAPHNGGDINGDGIDDMVLTLPVYPSCVTAVYYGSANPTGIPDLTITVPYELNDYTVSWPLGDINGDGLDDMVIYCPLWSNPHIDRLIIWTGNEAQFLTLAETTNGTVARTAIGVGDVNADNLDDFVLQYGIPGGTNMNSRIVLYYGSVNYPELDSLVISDNTNSGTIRSASPLGDLDGDGYADFEAYVGKVWFGGTDLSPVSDLQLVYNNPPYHFWGSPAYNVGNHFIYGDLNGDGYDEVIGSCYDINYYEGEVGIWVGGPNMDGLIDMYLYPPDDYGTRNYGYAKAAGDVNGDGLCDLAVSAPMFYSAPLYATGRVFIYSGNTALTDTVVANDDPAELEPGWELNVYPNPFNPSTTIAFNIPETGRARVSIYNSKGQRVIDLLDAELTQGDHSLVWDGRDENNLSVASGIYFIKLESGGKTSIRKAMLVK